MEANLGGVFQQTARDGMGSFLAALPEQARASSENRTGLHVPRLRITPGARGVYDNGPTELRTVAILTVVVGFNLLIVCANLPSWWRRSACSA